MTHYQKIAAIVFRVIAVIFLIIGLLSLISALLFSLPSTNLFMILIVFLPYFVGSAGLFALSKFLAKLVCFDLDKSDE
jgi:hypothetical protein